MTLTRSTAGAERVVRNGETCKVFNLISNTLSGGWRATRDLTEESRVATCKVVNDSVSDSEAFLAGSCCTIGRPGARVMLMSAGRFLAAARGGCYARWLALVRPGGAGKRR